MRLILLLSAAFAENTADGSMRLTINRVTGPSRAPYSTVANSQWLAARVVRHIRRSTTAHGESAGPFIRRLIPAVRMTSKAYLILTRRSGLQVP